MRVALVHDHLVQDGGAERVLREFQALFPGSPTFTLVYDAKRLSKEFPGADIRTSFLQKIPFAVQKCQWLLPLMPSATESYDLSDFDVVLSSTSAFAKGVITKPGTVHVCYCHTPTRYLWSDTHSYVAELKANPLVKALLPPLLSQLRVWDRLAAGRVDNFIANSETVRGRIQKYYERDSEVIYPPVEIEKFSVGKPEDWFLAGGRLVSYKRFDLIIRAFNRLGLKLRIFGDGPMYREYRKLAKANIEFVGRVNDAEKAELYRKSQAFLNPQEEDFGITTVEAMASGRPVIAYRKGGATETVIEGVTGIFFDHQEWEDLASAIIGFDQMTFDPAKIRAHAEQFGSEVFRSRIAKTVRDAYRDSQDSGKAK
jgi:glycosyltransferase involved in cell wall biosynthesis